MCFGSMRAGIWWAGIQSTLGQCNCSGRMRQLVSQSHVEGAAVATFQGGEQDQGR